MATVTITDTHFLEFDDGTPVRAASAVTRIADRWLIAQDDANHAALWDKGVAERLRVFAPMGGIDHFRSSDGTKHLKPDLEAACTITADGRDAALLLGSGSLPNRMRVALVTWHGGEWGIEFADLAPLYDRVAEALQVPVTMLNLEGACPVGEHLRWFQRGHAQGVGSAAVDIELDALLGALRGDVDPHDLVVSDVTIYDLGEAEGVPLAVTDAVALHDGRIVVSAAAEDAPDAVEDGPIVGSALAVLDGADVAEVVALPLHDDEVLKVEGLALHESADGDGIRLLGVVDQDDPDRPSLALELHLT